MPYVYNMKRVSAYHDDTKENYNDDIRNLNAKRGPHFYNSKDIPAYERKQQVRYPYEKKLLTRKLETKPPEYWQKIVLQLPSGKKQYLFNKSFTDKFVPPSFINYQSEKNTPAMKIKNNNIRFPM